MLSFIKEKIRDKPDPNAKPAMDFDSKTPAERDKQVKILVPNSTAGMTFTLNKFSGITQTSVCRNDNRKGWRIYKTN